MRARSGITSHWLFAGAASVLALPSTALSQQTLPTRDELTRTPPPSAAPRPTLNVVGGIERSPCPLDADQFAGVKVTISEVVFNNLKGVAPEELRPAWTSYAGQEHPVRVLCDIRDGAATILRNRGYLAAVQVPTQRIENGVVHMETLFARLVTVRARGQTSGAEEKLAAYLGKLTQDEVFDRNRAERYLLLARDLPGYNVQLSLRPAGTGPGELIGEVSVVRNAYMVDATVQNLASRETGRWGGQLRLQLFGLTGMGDVTTASIYTTAQTREQQILQLGHSFRPGNEGLVVDLNATRAWTKPDIGEAPGAPDLTADTLFLSAGVRYPIRRSLSSNLWLGGGFDFLNQKVDFFGPQSRDRLRVAYARLGWDKIDLSSRLPRYRFAANLELRKGLDILNATDTCPDNFCPTGILGPSRPDGENDAMVVRASGSAELALGKSMALAISPSAQLALDPVFAFEEYTVGNYTVGRGYDPAYISGDSGAGVQIELRGPRIGWGRQGRSAIQPFAFSDLAWTWTKDADEDDPQHVKSVGGGARIDLDNRFHLDATLAVPLEAAGPLKRRGDTRLLVSLTSRLLPWR